MLVVLFGDLDGSLAVLICYLTIDALQKQSLDDLLIGAFYRLHQRRPSVLILQIGVDCSCQKIRTNRDTAISSSFV
jgi:hypothetical protein